MACHRRKRRRSSPFNFMIPQVMVFTFLFLTSFVAISKDIGHQNLTLATAWNVTNTIVIGVFIAAAFRESHRAKAAARRERERPSPRRDRVAPQAPIGRTSPPADDDRATSPALEPRWRSPRGAPCARPTCAPTAAGPPRHPNSRHSTTSPKGASHDLDQSTQTPQRPAGRARHRRRRDDHPQPAREPSRLLLGIHPGAVVLDRLGLSRHGCGADRQAGRRSRPRPAAHDNSEPCAHPGAQQHDDQRSHEHRVRGDRRRDAVAAGHRERCDLEGRRQRGRLRRRRAGTGDDRPRGRNVSSAPSSGSSPTTSLASRRARASRSILPDHSRVEGRSPTSA